MPSLETILRKDIFKIANQSDFERLAIKIFNFQYANNRIYKLYTDLLNINPKKVKSLNSIPFLPIEFFKSQKIILKDRKTQIIFKSSGTTSAERSRHMLADITLYQESFTRTFEHFYGKPQNFCFIALLPSYIEAGDSSLVYMVDSLIKMSKNKLSGFYFNNDERLLETVKILTDRKIKTIIIGVSFALLELAEKSGIKLNNNFILMETGGMKGRRKEIIREELHEILCNSLAINKVHSEYGMTELLSQAYSKGSGRFKSPPWMQVLIREINDPFAYLGLNRTGGINIIDLANLYSCSFIETKDLGRKHRNGCFEVLGRFDNSDIRGCNLLI